MNQTQYRSLSLPKTVVAVGSLLCLLAGWALLVACMLVLTDALFNPWDAAPASALPPAGTLSRVLYDLFSRSPTVFLPALLVLGMSVALFVKQAVSSGKLTPVAFRFAAINVGLVSVGALATPFVWNLERRLLEVWGASLDYSYSRHLESRRPFFLLVRFKSMLNRWTILLSKR